jgi:hypothetical protein
MTRINDSQHSVQQQQQAEDAKRSQQSADSARRFNESLKKNERRQEPAPQQAKQADDTKKKADAGAVMQRQQMAVFGRREGTVADLQAKLDAQAASKGADAQAALEGGAGGIGADGKGLGIEGKGGGLGMGEGGEKALSLDMAMKSDAAGFGGLQGQAQLQQAGGVAAGSATVEVSGPKIPTAMMEKIVDNARVGVNEVGSPEFQFDLKGDVLGGMKMRISMEDGKLKAIFVAENNDVRRFIDGNLKDLQKNLEDRGIYIKDLEVRDPEEDRRQRQRDQNNKDRESMMG